MTYRLGKKGRPARRKGGEMASSEMARQMRELTLMDAALYVERGIKPSRPCACSETSEPAECRHSRPAEECPCWCHGEHAALVAEMARLTRFRSYGENVDYDQEKIGRPSDARVARTRVAGIVPGLFGSTLEG